MEIGLVLGVLEINGFGLQDLRASGFRVWGFEGFLYSAVTFFPRLQVYHFRGLHYPSHRIGFLKNLKTYVFLKNLHECLLSHSAHHLSAGRGASGLPGWGSQRNFRAFGFRV